MAALFERLFLSKCIDKYYYELYCKIEWIIPVIYIVSKDTSTQYEGKTKDPFSG